MAFGVLADVATGYPLLLSEMTFVTALRTAGDIGAGRAPHGAPGEPRHGADRQRRAERISGDRLSPHARHPRTAAVRHRSPRPPPSSSAISSRCASGSRVRSCASIAEAVRGADIVTTVTADKRNALILTPEMIEPGMHLNAVGGDCPGKTELHRGHSAAAHARIVVEFEPQARIEGEIQQLEPRRASPSSPTCCRARRPGAPRCTEVIDLRLGGIRAQRLLRAALPAPAEREIRAVSRDRPHPESRRSEGSVRRAQARAPSQARARRARETA